MPKLTIEQVSQFLTEKGAAAECSQCRQNVWVFVDEPHEALWAIASTRTDGGVVMPMPSIPVIALACGNCGFLRLHARVPIDEWARKEIPTSERKS